MVAGTASYPLPADFCSVISVDCFISGSGNDSMVRSAMRFPGRAAQHVSLLAHGRLDAGHAGATAFRGRTSRSFRFRKRRIRRAELRADGEVLVSADGDSIDSINGWDECGSCWTRRSSFCRRRTRRKRIGQLMPYLQRQEMRIAAAA